MRNGFQKFISGKGFYLALAVCLAGAGAAAWVAVDKTIQNIESTPLSDAPQTQQEEPLQSAEQNLSDVPQDDLSAKEDAEDSTSAAADGDSAPYAQSQRPQINADAGEQDDSSTQVSQPSVQSESSTSVTESAEASTQPEEQQPSADFSLTLPVSGAAITPFSGDMLVKNETLGDWRTHNGIDISAATGTAVTAASDGTVTSVYNDPMWGNVIEVTSGDYLMTYAGLGDDIAVSVDQQITTGQTLGSIGQIPCELSLEPHLHFDVQYNGDYVDPASLVE